ncbi:MAG TPA: response regulator, partial [Bryobacteraceae bacterium]|nr:response regulator [Bryobacteraceae bacterium]
MNVEILIVEDEGLIALDLKKRLEQVGYKVVAVADNGEDAIRNAGNLKPDVILMDIRLRGPMDGVEIADEIRKRFYIPVIFVTAHADRETLDRARTTEPFGYIVKPFHGIDFRVQIEVALWRHKMEQKLRVSQAWLSATFENVADGLIATDESGNIALMNKPAGLLTGWDAEEAKGRPLDEVFRVSDEISGLPAANAAAPGFRTFILSPRGDFEPPIIEAEISENRDEGKIFGVIIAFRDITERRKAERRDRQVQKMNALTLMATGLGRELAESQSRMDESIKFLIENT